MQAPPAPTQSCGRSASLTPFCRRLAPCTCCAPPSCWKCWGCAAPGTAPRTRSAWTPCRTGCTWLRAGRRRRVARVSGGGGGAAGAWQPPRRIGATLGRPPATRAPAGAGRRPQGGPSERVCRAPASRSSLAASMLPAQTTHCAWPVCCSGGPGGAPAAGAAPLLAAGPFSFLPAMPHDVSDQVLCRRIAGLTTGGGSGAGRAQRQRSQPLH